MSSTARIHVCMDVWVRPRYDTTRQVPAGGRTWHEGRDAADELHQDLGGHERACVRCGLLVVGLEWGWVGGLRDLMWMPPVEVVRVRASVCTYGHRHARRPQVWTELIDRPSTQQHKHHRRVQARVGARTVHEVQLHPSWSDGQAWIGRRSSSSSSMANSRAPPPSSLMAAPPPSAAVASRSRARPKSLSVVVGVWVAMKVGRIETHSARTRCDRIKLHPSVRLRPLRGHPTSEDKKSGNRREGREKSRQNPNPNGLRAPLY